MPLPTADSAAPIAVLVLAWDETTPAVRALVEATQAPTPTVEALLVMVPQAADPAALSAQEYLPPDALPAPPPSEPAKLTEPPTLAAPAPAALPLAATKETPALPPPLTAEAAPSPTAAGKAPAASAESTLPAAVPAAAEAAPAPSAAVRVLRLGSLSLAELSARAGQPLPSLGWLSASAPPAAPYLGATLAEPAPALPAQAVAAPVLPAALATVEEAPATAPTASLAASTDREEGTIALPVAGPAELANQLAAVENDPLPLANADLPVEQSELAQVAEELAQFELAASALPSLLAEFEAPFNASQASWSEALAMLQQPEPAAPTPLPPAEAPVASGLPPAPEAVPYETAAKLNFKIIQYARFAVPVALAEAPYDVLYAPAWPTWLAAQELRQRTGRPLVLHIATLAAADEPLDLAAGWPAEIQRQALHRADLILTETPALAYRLRRELDLPAHRVRPVPAADAAAVAQALSTAHVW